MFSVWSDLKTSKYQHFIVPLLDDHGVQMKRPTRRGKSAGVWVAWEHATAQERGERLVLCHSRRRHLNPHDYTWITNALGPVYIHRVQRTTATMLIIAAKQVSVFS